MMCDNCEKPARYLVFAGGRQSYDTASLFPAAMMRDCGDHLVERVREDQRHGGHTPGYFLEVVG